MNFFVLLGPPGAGKGTQSELLKQRLNFIHISTGDIIRREIAKQSELGKSVKAIVESGHFVDDQTILKCLSSHLGGLSLRPDDVVLLDGIPRNLPQADALDHLLSNKLLGIIALTADVDNLVERFQKRWFCQACSSIVSLNNSPTSDTVCVHCGAKNTLIRRKDDDPAIVRERFKIYADQTSSLLKFYSERKILHEFNALDSVEKLYVQIANCIIQKIDGKC